MANLAPLVNGRGPLYVDADGIVRRTTYHLMQMYATLLGADLVESVGTSDTLECGDDRSIPVIDSVVTQRGDRVVVALVNRHPTEALGCEIRLDGVPLAVDDAIRTTLEGDSADAFNSPREPDRVVPHVTRERIDAGAVSLPAHSVSILEFAAKMRPSQGEWIRGTGVGRATRDVSGRGPRVDCSYSPSYIRYGRYLSVPAVSGSGISGRRP
jgi:alpha-N-arabinofuranosidase